jgi:phage terminase small subunit
MNDIPAPPIPLGPHAKDKWAELAPSVQPSLQAELAAYCMAYQRWLDAEAWLAEPGHSSVVTITDDKGNVKTHAPAPQLKVIEGALKEMDRLGRKLRLHTRK